VAVLHDSEAMCSAVHYAVLAQGLDVEGGLKAEQQGRLYLHRLSNGTSKYLPSGVHSKMIPRKLSYSTQVRLN
jgi:hypothetical protein